MAETRELTRFILDTNFEQLPKEVVERAKICVLDYLASASCGSTKDWSGKICNYVKQIGCKRESAVIASRLRTSPQYAALANGTMGHGFELDDFHTMSFVHPGAVVIPAALAVAEKEKASGSEFLTAVILGYEVMVRLGLAVGIAHSVRGFHATGTTGPFGAAVAAGKIMNLDQDHMLHAFGIAGSFSSGLKEFYLEGGTVKRLHAGKAAENGVTAALLAREGFTGPSTVLEGKFGFCRAFSDDFDLRRLRDGLKQKWQIMTVNTKPYPCCGGIHPAVNGLQDLKAQYTFLPEEVEKVAVETCERIASQNAGPGTQTIMSAQYSIPFCSAVTLLRDIEDPSVFNDAALRDEEILALSRKVEVIGRPEISGIEQSRVTVRLKGGKEYKIEIDRPKGHPDNPLNSQDVIGKFKKLAADVYSMKTTGEIIETVGRLEEAENLSSLCNLLQEKR
jgi:2-methylcitrate dehydratase PrpD